MDRQTDARLAQIKSAILKMGGAVESAVSEAMSGLTQRKDSHFKKVFEIEESVNQGHIDVDELCMEFIATEGPKARDLRFVVSTIKINNDLERMGDQAVNMSHAGKDYLKHPAMTYISEIEKMSVIAQKMLKGSLDSFVTVDEVKARAILMMDDELDELKLHVFQDMTHLMKVDSSKIDACMDLIQIARNLERLGDHATNIAEDVIFVSSGKDIRHGRADTHR